MGSLLAAVINRSSSIIAKVFCYFGQMARRPTAEKSLRWTYNNRARYIASIINQIMSGLFSTKLQIISFKLFARATSYLSAKQLIGLVAFKINQKGEIKVLKSLGGRSRSMIVVYPTTFLILLTAQVAVRGRGKHATHIVENHIDLGRRCWNHKLWHWKGLAFSRKAAVSAFFVATSGRAR